MENKTDYHLNALPDRNQRGAFSLYCDDVRQESSGKRTFVGTYGSEMYVSDFPAILPLFFIVTTAWTSHSRPFEKLIFRILLDDVVLSEQTIDVQEARAKLFGASGSESVDHNSSSRQSVQAVVRLSPFILEKECVLRVRIETEDGELRTSGITIRRGVKSAESADGADSVSSAPSEGAKGVSN